MKPANNHINPKIIIIIVLTFFTLNNPAQTWKPYFGDSLYNQNGAIRIVYDFHIFNNNLYACGALGYSGSTLLKSIGYWDGIKWNNMNYGPTLDIAQSIEDFKGEIYIGGSFWFVDSFYCKYFAKYNGTGWDSVGTGMPNNNVLALKFKNELYLGGNFGQIGTSNYKAIASWNDTTYGNVKGGLTGGYMECDAMCIYNDMLVVGGNFTKAGTTPALSIAMWDGTNFHNLGQGVSSFVWGLVTDTINNFLYVGGADMYWAGGLSVNNIAMWDGYNWNNVGNGIQFYGETLCMYKGELYAGSNLTSNEETLHFISRWDGLTWDSVGTGFKGYPKAMIVYNDELLVGGKINYINDTVRSPGFARWHLPYTYNCNALQPRIHTVADTFYLNNGTVNVQLYNNNAYSPYWQWNFGDSETDSVQTPLHTYTDTGTYTVSVTVAHDVCTKTAEKQITILNPTSINQLLIANCQLLIYPNPSNNQFTIETSITQGTKGEVRIYGIRGELINEITIESAKSINTINVSEWKRGNYVCGLYINQKLIKSEKIVIH